MSACRKEKKKGKKQRPTEWGKRDEWRGASSSKKNTLLEWLRFDRCFCSTSLFPKFSLAQSILGVVKGEKRKEVDKSRWAKVKQGWHDDTSTLRRMRIRPSVRMGT